MSGKNLFVSLLLVMEDKRCGIIISFVVVAFQEKEEGGRKTAKQPGTRNQEQTNKLTNQT